MVGDRWTLLVLREAFLRRRRFDEMQRDLGIARNILADRLQRLVAEGLLDCERCQDRPERFEYRLTDKGLDLYPALVALMAWGDRHAADDVGPPVELVHRGCGQVSHPRLACDRCGEPVGARDMVARPGPGAALSDVA